jgi:hypothetical protein
MPPTARFPARRGAGAGERAGCQPTAAYNALAGRLAADDTATLTITEARGASNTKSKRELGWPGAEPAHLADDRAHHPTQPAPTFANLTRAGRFDLNSMQPAIGEIEV